VGHRDGPAGTSGTTEFYTRQQASIVFKRLVDMHWDERLHGKDTVILPESEKAVVRSGLVPVSHG